MTSMWAAPRGFLAACAGLVLALSTRSAQAQIFHFQETPVPATYSLSTHYMFYVYAKEDGPKGADAGATSRVEFRQLAASPSKTASAAVPQKYPSVEVSLLPFDKFWSLVNKDKFCSSFDDVRSNRAKEGGKFMINKPMGSTLETVGASIEQVPFITAGSKAPQTVSHMIKKTGIYILTFTNCGNFSDATVSGSLAVKNTYGFLPGNEIYTMKLFGWLTVIYTFIFVVMLVASLRHYKALFYIQKGIASIIFLCVLECLLTWVQYQDWNLSGERRDLYFVSSLLFYTLKYVLSWRLILLSSLGAGVVLQDLDGKTSVLFFVASTLFMIQSCMWKLLISYRYSHALESGFLMIVTLPGVIVYAGMFLWTFLALQSLIARIEEHKQDDLVKTFKNVRMVLFAGLTLSVCVLFLQVVDIASGGIFPWEYQWFSVDGAPQFTFMLVLVLMMWVWWPNENSWKYGYMVQVSQDDGAEGENAAVNTAQDDIELSKGRIPAEQIGAAEEL